MTMKKNMGKEDKILISVEEAIALLPKGEQIHTFYSHPNMLIGADHSRESILNTLKTALKLEIGGKMCMGMGHGLVAWETEKRPLFIKHDEEAMKQYA